jgi:hypothetical protein
VNAVAARRVLGGGLTVAAFAVEVKAAATGTARAEEAAGASVILEISSVGARAACGVARTANAGRSVADVSGGAALAPPQPPLPATPAPPAPLLGELKGRRLRAQRLKLLPERAKHPANRR